MNIKQKLTSLFAVTACLPVILVAGVVIMNVRSQATGDFLDGSGREIRQIDRNIQQFFAGIQQNVDFLAKEPNILALEGLKNYSGADAAQLPQPEAGQQERPGEALQPVDRGAVAAGSAGQRDQRVAGRGVRPDRQEHVVGKAGPLLPGLHS